jgi:hypothetical protein
MSEIEVTLSPDGSSDAALVPILKWVFSRDCPDRAPQIRVARGKPPGNLSERLKWALQEHPCDLLIVHRDAEGQSLRDRQEELTRAVTQLGAAPSTVILVPVKMMEAWLLIDEVAIRRAAGNPNGRVELRLPRFRELETIPDPKSRLHDSLRSASELSGRRLKNFHSQGAASRVAQLIADFEPLIRLSAFQQFRADLRIALSSLPAA